jgi:hypothetical protein
MANEGDTINVTFDRLEGTLELMLNEKESTKLIYKNLVFLTGEWRAAVSLYSLNDKIEFEY